ncbi:oxidoreductase [Candidatus Koribacter versatilis Ellin345]|uniref:Oxidoreductase n=1 Tax=Koribacter versatilis (strain Ellin345) TaxID=204669 RepID=Q1ISR8_KORVE|nr:Gfo/Idh/MocA family oxidoreductase [Candidatus Koribacter versatilis]ABF40082.1 oxidoreductase [Candidatus Koribacter versatilis Ellin345]
MLKVGLVGMGYWGPNLARVLNQSPKCEFVAACDLNPRNLDKITRQYPTVVGYRDFDAFLQSDVQAVVIATPISTHYELAKAALLAGKHVFVEKPIADAGSKARKLVELANKTQHTLFVGHTFIYSPPVIKVKQLIDSGDLGDIHYVSLSRVNLGLYQSDVDVVWDLAVHDVSILLYWLGEKPIRGAAFGRACVQSEKRDVAFLWLEFPSGIIAHNEISWLSPQKMRRTCVVGSKRMVVYDDMDSAEKVKVYDRGVNVKEPSNFGEFQLTYRMGDMYAPYLENAEPLLREIEHFVACCEQGVIPTTSGEFGAQVVETLEMVNRTDVASWNTSTMSSVGAQL